MQTRIAQRKLKTYPRGNVLRWDGDVLCFSTGYFDEPMWTNRQHLMARLARTHRVLYVEPGLFNRRYFMRMLLSRPWKLLGGVSQPRPQLWVLSPHLLPLYRMGSYWRRLAWWVLIRWIRSFCRRHNFRNVLVWSYEAEMVGALAQLDAKGVVYDCVDEFSAIPYFQKRPRRREEFIRAETALIRRADAVITTSQTLYAAKARLHPGHVFLVENVGDFEHFHRAAQKQPLPPDIGCIPGPRVGFFGAVSAYKLDFPLLVFLAQRMPAVHFVFIGPVGEGDRQTRVQALRQHSNIHLLGPRPYDRLPEYVRAFDVCMIPYRRTSYVRGVFPIKFFECLATGKPLVTTALPALQKYKSVFYSSPTPNAFVRNLQRALREPGTQRRARQIQLARANTWEQRLEKILCIVRQQSQPK